MTDHHKLGTRWARLALKMRELGSCELAAGRQKGPGTRTQSIQERLLDHLNAHEIKRQGVRKISPREAHITC